MAKRTKAQIKHYECWVVLAERVGINVDARDRFEAQIKALRRVRDNITDGTVLIGRKPDKSDGWTTVKELTQGEWIRRMAPPSKGRLSSSKKAKCPPIRP